MPNERRQKQGRLWNFSTYVKFKNTDDVLIYGKMDWNSDCLWPRGAAEIAWKGLKGTQWDGENVAGLDGDSGVYEHLHSCNLRL